MLVKNILAKIGYTGDDLHFSIEDKHFHMLLACMPVCVFERECYTLLWKLYCANFSLDSS